MLRDAGCFSELLICWILERSADRLSMFTCGRAGTDESFGTKLDSTRMRLDIDGLPVPRYFALETRLP